MAKDIELRKVWVVGDREFASRSAAREYIDGGKYQDLILAVSETIEFDGTTEAAKIAQATKFRRTAKLFCEGLEELGCRIEFPETPGLKAAA